jgi:hypothetical protein
MHLTDHVTDVQLNEYLDRETSSEGRVQIEAHLALCDECTVRLTALQALFAEIESLTELELSKPLVVPLRPPSSLLAPQLPRWITLALTLQAFAALFAIVFILPLVTQYLGPVVQAVSVPTLRDVLVEIQMYFGRWMQVMQSFQPPTIPVEIFTPPEGLSPTLLSVSLSGIFFLWLIGNWWLLRKRPNSLA